MSASTSLRSRRSSYVRSKLPFDLTVDAEAIGVGGELWNGEGGVDPVEGRVGGDKRRQTLDTEIRTGGKGWKGLGRSRQAGRLA